MENRKNMIILRGKNVIMEILKREVPGYARYGDCWLRLIGQIDLFILSNLFKYYNWIWNFWNPFYSSVSNNKEKKQLSEIVKTWQPFHFWKALTVLLQVCRDLQNRRQSLRLGSWMKMSNVRLRALSIFFGKVKNVN